MNLHILSRKTALPYLITSSWCQANAICMNEAFMMHHHCQKWPKIFWQLRLLCCCLDVLLWGRDGLSPAKNGRWIRHADKSSFYKKKNAYENRCESCYQGFATIGPGKNGQLIRCLAKRGLKLTRQLLLETILNWPIETIRLELVWPMKLSLSLKILLGNDIFVGWGW